MKKLCSKSQNSLLLLFIFCLPFIVAVPARADSAPDWLRQLARAPLPAYDDDTNGVVLLNQQTVTVKDDGEVVMNFRYAAKILRRGGRGLSELNVPFYKDEKVEHLHGWSIAANGQEYEVKEKDALEHSPFADSVYEDARAKLMVLPAAEVGTCVGYEYEKHSHPDEFTRAWFFQSDMPVRSARYTLNLPAGWEFQYRFANWQEQKPEQLGGNSWSWEMHDLDAVEEEADMPAWLSLAGRMAISFYSPSLPPASRLITWNDVGSWFNGLNASRRASTPKLKDKVAELTAGKSDSLEKLYAITHYVQHNIRYVEISIGKQAGYQAHMAGDTFSNSYGDCKDKATLLLTMLHEAGIEGYMALVDSERGVVNPAVPSLHMFDHVIVAIKIPADLNTTNLYTAVDDPALGKIAFFDPTSEMTPFGMLPSQEQDSYALVVTDGGSQLVKIPTLPPALNRLLRVAHLQLTPDGALTGEVQEVRSGAEATYLRARLLYADRDKQMQLMETFLAEFLDRVHLTYASVAGLDKYDEPLVLKYKFEAVGYAKSAGDLMLVRPRVLGKKSHNIAENKKRKYPVENSTTLSESDEIDIKLPPGYKVDELPEAANVTAPFAEYKSKIEAKDNVLYYNRSYTVKDLTVPVDQMSTLRTFMRGVAADERNTAVLKKAQP